LTSKSVDPWRNVPDHLRSEVEKHLEAGETVGAWFEVDLNTALQFCPGLVVLTDRRILSVDPPPGSSEHPLGRIPQANTPDRDTFHAWALNPNLQLRAEEQTGVGILRLLGADCQLAHWRYTTSRAPSARRLIQRLEEIRRGTPDEAEEEAAPTGPVCPICGEVLGTEQYSCPICSGDAPVTARSLFRLLRFVRPWMWVGLFGFVLMLAGTAMSLVPPLLTMPLVDTVIVPYQSGKAVDFGVVQWYMAGLLGAAVLTWLLTWGRTYILAWVSERVSAELRNRVYEHLHKLSLDFFGGKRTGDLISRVGTDTDRINFFLSIYLLDFANDVLMIGMTAIVLLRLDWLLAVATLVPLPLIAWLVQRVRNRLRRGFKLSSAAWGEMTAVLADTIPGIRVVKAFAQEHREIDRFRQANDRVLATNDRVNTLWSFFGATVTFLTDLGLAAVWVVAVWRIYQHHMTLGVLQVFVAYVTRFYGRLDSMSRMMAASQRAAASAQRIFEVLDRVPSVPQPLRPVHPERLRGSIELRNIGFRYGTRPVLEGVDLSIRAGEMIGLVGPSGAGKSTIINLLCRFYDVTEGAILVDGIDIRSFLVEEYRKHIGLVLQEPFLFYGTIAENIAYGNPDATREEIVAAARAARAHEFILRQPDGYDSLVGERGQTLSGGERQRISIARALLIDPRILILDEATSSVDTETEREIQLALENLIQGRTTIAIAHRLSTLRRADRLVVIERGHITEVGKHNELLETAGTYARLYRAQQDMDSGHIAPSRGA
jgi:ATP-binding cassette subfamily B protein